MAALEAAIGLTLALAVAAPHTLPLRRVTPAVSATLWLCALALRALIAIAISLLVFVYMPRTGVYDAVAHWCWHQALPLVATHLGLSGHPIIHAAIVLPALALAGSLLWVACGATRAWLALRPKLRAAVGRGPLGSTIIADDSILVAVPTLGRGRIVVSDAAMAVMDADELRASLNHELGHIHRRHRPLVLATAVLAALGRPLPGTRVAVRELLLCLERDADDYAVARTRDPLALASAICKAATPGPLAGTTGLGGGGRVLHRLDYLQGQGPRAGRRLEGSARLLAALSVILVLGLSMTLPSWALAAPRGEHGASMAAAHCARDNR